eukprot:CAMPEP_0202979772 /NCGR_PEP_ID=MMETSP1396-20130829/85837_1 /ASSEMBLY_ACC=CAM_ASM_000872 /TAXON_ID= /ORGANISM="Pseudokeronopsis sp., Strain Brazil" /LENGTH=127 /DNA_ID=CAMNT_0049719369 /DNA_START=687 /DNA_END=1070 /DNA_ORIENTATION=-
MQQPEAKNVELEEKGPDEEEIENEATILSKLEIEEDEKGLSFWGKCMRLLNYTRTNYATLGLISALFTSIAIPVSGWLTAILLFYLLGYSGPIELAELSYYLCLFLALSFYALIALYYTNYCFGMVG